MEHFMKDDALGYFVQRIREQLDNNLKRIILFGSKARGDDVVGSDYDCLVIVDAVSRKINDIVDKVAGETLYQYNTVFSVVLISEEKYNRQIYNPLLMNINKEGTIL